MADHNWFLFLPPEEVKRLRHEAAKRLFANKVGGKFWATKAKDWNKGIRPPVMKEKK